MITTMPQLVLREEDFAFVRQLVAETAPFTEEAGRLLNRMNALSLEFVDNRTFVEIARDEVRNNFRFTIDFEAEVFEVDAAHAWVNGWYLVQKEST